MDWKNPATLRDFTDGYENYFGFLGEFTSDHSKMERGLNHPSNNLLRRENGKNMPTSIPYCYSIEHAKI